MRTRATAWVRSLVLALGLAGQVQGAAPTSSSSGSSIFEPASSQTGSADPLDLADQIVICGQGSDSGFMSGDWRDILIGSTQTCHVYAGTELAVLNVDSQTGGRVTASFSDTTAPGVATIAFDDRGGLNDRGYAPRFWLGANLTDKWGVRGRYWHLAGSEEHAPDLRADIPPVGTNFGTFEVTDTLDAWTTDIEAVRNAQWGGWKLDGFVGARHASFSADSSFLAFGVFTTGNFINLTLQNGSEFDGTGVTYGGSLRRQIFKTPLYLFGSARGSYLDGQTNSMARAAGTVASSPSAPLVGASTQRLDGADAQLSIVEFQVGLEFNWPLQCVPASFFFRTAYEHQTWTIDGSSPVPTGFGGTIGELTTNSLSTPGLGGMTLSGVTLGTGLTW